MKRISWLWKNAEEVVCSTFLGIVVILLFIQVLARYVFNLSVPWTEELSRFAFLVFVFVGTSLAAKHNSHARVTAHIELLPKAMQRFFLGLSDLIWLAFNAIAIYYGFVVVQNLSAFPLVSPVMGWNLKYIFLIIPITMIIQSIRIIERNYKEFKESKVVTEPVTENRAVKGEIEHVN